MRVQKCCLLFTCLLIISLTNCERLSLNKNKLRSSALTSKSATSYFVMFSQLHSDVGVAADGTLWTVSNPEGNYIVRRWISSNWKWEETGGNGYQISVGSDGLPWVIGLDQGVYSMDSSGSWAYMSGKGYDIARGKRPQDAWLIGLDYRVYFWNGNSWQITSGAGKKVACDPDGNAWVIGSDDKVYKYIGNDRWQGFQRQAIDIGVGYDGAVFIVGGNKVTGGYEVYKYIPTTNTWQLMNNLFGTRIAVYSSTKIYLIDETFGCTEVGL